MVRRLHEMRWLLVLVSSTTSAAAPVSEPLQPIQPWVLDYAATQCTATREYGPSDKPFTLGIVPSSNGRTYELLVAHKHRLSTVEELDGSVDFGSGPMKAWLLEYGSHNKDMTIDRYRLSAEQFQQARSAKTVTFKSEGNDTRSFVLEKMPELIDAMQKCIANLHDYWNMDRGKSGKIKTPPRGNIRNDFSDSDYPGEAELRRQEGTGQYLLLIDEDGTVAGCDVLRPSGVPVLDAMGCAVIQERTRMAPALDKDGKPIRSTFVTPPIVWKLNL
jgi:TonB family protein